jgi:hypothetical protein
VTGIASSSGSPERINKRIDVRQPPRQRCAERSIDDQAHGPSGRMVEQQDHGLVENRPAQLLGRDEQLPRRQLFRLGGDGRCEDPREQDSEFPEHARPASSGYQFAGTRNSGNSDG